MKQNSVSTSSASLVTLVEAVLQSFRAGDRGVRLDSAQHSHHERALADKFNDLLDQLEKTSINKDTYADALRQTLKEYDNLLAGLSTFRRFGKLLTSNINCDAICHEVVRIIVDELDLENCSIMVITEDRRQLRLVAAFGQADRFGSLAGPVAYNSELKIDLGSGIAGQVAVSREPRLITDVSSDSSFSALNSLVDVKSLLCLPLISNDEVLGVINLSHPEIDSINQHHKRLFTITSDLVANLLHRGQLSEDINQRNRQELKEAMHREALLDQAANEVVLLLEASGTIVYCNSKAARTLGGDASQLIGRKMSDLPMLDAESAQRHREALRKVSSHLTVDPYEVAFILPDGKQHTIEFSLTGVTKGGLGEANFLVIGRDISERKRLQAQILHAEKFASIGTLAAGISHEILNPLHIISMSTQLLQQGDSDEEFRHETYDTINRQVARITKIVRGIKSFAQQQDHTVGPISIPEVIEQALELIAHAFRTRGIAVALNLGEHLPPVQGDRDQILQVFVNLLTNARDVMPNGGSLDISAAVTVVDSQRSIQTKICDTGPGIPHEIKSRIFDPFFTTKEIDQGTGLGLSICHGFIAEHGGTIYAESVVDQGTTMIVNLPIKDGPTP